MKYSLCAAALTALSFTDAASIHRKPRFSPRADTTGGLVNNCVGIGFLPSDGSSASQQGTMAQIDKLLGAKAAYYGRYAQITNANFDGSQLLSVKQDVISSGAIFVASVMPTMPLNQISSDVAQKVAAALKQFTDAGVEVWLRFGHEMNWYVTDGTYHGSASDFIAAWKNIHAANCAGNSKVKCFWSPNRAQASSLTQWWPGKDLVDVVGIDCYPSSSESTSDPKMFDTCYKDFYDMFAAANNLPFAIGETGAGDGQKENWLKQLVSQDHSKYPLYTSMSWFEYDKEADFRIVTSDASTLQQTKQILLTNQGSGSCPLVGGGSGNGTTSSPSGSPSGAVLPSGTDAPAPAAAKPTKGSKSGGNQQGTCTWGCQGWDCSASVPCQGSYTCKGGYCK